MPAPMTPTDFSDLTPRACWIAVLKRNPWTPCSRWFPPGVRAAVGRI
jgi:hypothetical protein